MTKTLAEALYFTGSNLGPIVAIVGPFILLVLFVGLPLSYLTESAAVLWGFWAVILLVQPIYMCRLIKYMHSVVTNQPREIRVSLAEWLNLFTVYVLYGLAVLLGLVVLVIPGIYVAARYGFAEFEVVLNRKQPIDSLKGSWQLTRGNIRTLFWGVVVVHGVALLIDVPLLVIADFNRELAILSDLVSELVSIGSMIFMSVFFFRMYQLHQDQSAEVP